MENPFKIILDKLNNIERLLKDSQAVDRSKDHNYVEFLNVKEVAEYLSLSISTIYGLVNKMEIPNHKRGKRLYFKKPDIEEWLSKSRRKTKEEIEKEALNYIIRKKRI